MRALNQFQEYLVHEFVDDYNDGLMPRRDMIRRVLRIMGTAAGAATILTSLGVKAEDALAAQSTSVATPSNGANNPLSVSEDDPAVSAAEITFDSSGTEIMAYEARPNPAPEGATPLILVCHENRGLTPHIRDVTRRLAKEGYVSVAVDLVSRDGGTAAHNEADIPDLLTRPDPAQHAADFQAAVDSYGSDVDVDTARLGMVGYCFGGGITWRAATIMQGLKAAAPYYGPPPPLEDVPNIKAAVLGVYSDDPEDFANKGREELEQALTDAGIIHQINIYPGTMHAFHNDTGQRYNGEQAQQAWTDTLAWFAEHV
jgi:carboxymethylenebutenolidase